MSTKEVLDWIFFYVSCITWSQPCGRLLIRCLFIQARSPTLTATELRERLLREKVKALRKSSNGLPEREVCVD